MSKKDSLGNRMKEYYEARNKYLLIRRMPVIIRLDGKAFHTFTKGLKRPFDAILIETMQETAKYLCENIQGCKIAYTQSDEITLLLTDFHTIKTDGWFNYEVEKMVSISASMATLQFNRIFAKKVALFAHQNVYYKNFEQYMVDEGDISQEKYDKYKEDVAYLKVLEKKVEMGALFDSRCFNIPKEEVVNCFLWRQQDATRNAIQMIAQSQFSQSALSGKSCNAIQEMLFSEKNINFNDFATYLKRGSCIIQRNVEVSETITRKKWVIDLEIPIFSKDRQYIEELLPSNNY